jgi:hypothetical protein
MKTNCTCPEKTEMWEFENSIGCWYVTSECDVCSYYWEGPDYSKTNHLVHPTKGSNHSDLIDSPAKNETRTEESGTFHIYCYDIQGRYGSPVKLKEPFL